MKKSRSSDKASPDAPKRGRTEDFNELARHYRKMNEAERAESILRGEGELMILALGQLPSRATDQWIDAAFRDAYIKAENPKSKLDLIRAFELHYAERCPRSDWYQSMYPRVTALDHFADEEKAATPKPGRRQQRRSLTTREKIIRQAIKLTGRDYAAFLDGEGLDTPERWRKNNDNPCPKSHLAAYKDPYWQHQIQKEKSRVAARMKREKRPH